MKRILRTVLIASCALLVAGVSLAKVTAPSKHVEATGEAYHHLLLLDLREAADHAKVLNHYARTHTGTLDKVVLTKHVEEITKNLDGIKTNLATIEEKMGPEKAALEPRLGEIGKQRDLAQQDLDALKLAIAVDKPDPTVIIEKSKSINTEMTAAREFHRKAMTKQGVHEPVEPATNK